MAIIHLGVGQNEAKECYPGNVRVNRYGVWNGLERPRRIDSQGNLTLMGLDPPLVAPYGTALVNIGELDSGWYSYRHIPLNRRHVRPVPESDETQDFTRGNPSPVSSAILVPFGYAACSIWLPRYLADQPRTDVPLECTDIGLYRTRVFPSSDASLVGPWFFTSLIPNNSSANGNLHCVDVTADDNLGEEIETDNFPPDASPFALEIDDTFFAGGRRVIGEGLTLAVASNASVLLLETAGRRFYDGIRGWRLHLEGDYKGGMDGLGNFFASYIDSGQIGLHDADLEDLGYDGAFQITTGQEFRLYKPGDALRWSKIGEPESWPINPYTQVNLVNTQGDIIGLGRIPNQPTLVLFTDKPEVRIFDVTILESPAFKDSVLISNEFMGHHFSLHPVESFLRGIDPHRGTIWETDGSTVRDLTHGILKEIWTYLSTQYSKQENWHAIYDQYQKIYAAFVTLGSSNRLVDFAILQYLRTGRWFFAWPKDMLCSCPYLDPETGQWMVLGGTQGLGETGGRWGRIFTPGHYSMWVPGGTKRQGTIVGVPTPTQFTVDVTDGILFHTAGDGLQGMEVLVCDANDENEQIGLISANTGTSLTVNHVYGSTFSDQFDPLPIAGWKFYVGLIEVRWGPKRFTMQDPTIKKHVLDFYTRVAAVDSSNLPFVRLYKGLEPDYDKQIVLSRGEYPDGSYTEVLQNKTDPITPPHEWGFALMERSYNGIEIHDISFVWNPADVRQTRGKPR